MKKVKRFAVTAIVLALAAACCVLFTGCGPETIKGTGGIAPDGYKQVQKDGSSFYIPTDFSKSSGGGNGIDIYTFGDGNFNIATTSINIKVKDYTESMLESSYKLAGEMSGVAISVHIDAFRFYELSGLLIAYVENTTTYKTTGAVMKQYQFIYDTSSKQVSLTLTFNSVALSEGSDIPDKILHSIALS